MDAPETGSNAPPAQRINKNTQHIVNNNLQDIEQGMGNNNEDEDQAEDEEEYEEEDEEEDEAENEDEAEEEDGDEEEDEDNNGGDTIKITDSKERVRAIRRALAAGN
jgi:hypothetical protein